MTPTKQQPKKIKEVAAIQQPTFNDALTDPRLLDKAWRMSHLYKIRNKKDQLVTFEFNEAQKDFNQKKHTRNIILKSRQLGMCLDPKTRVLTADLRWVEIGNLLPGQEIIAVDELRNTRGKGRRMKTAVIEAVGRVKRKAYKITFDDGRSLTCTAQHPWLSKKTMTDAIWRAIEPTKHGKGVLTVGTKVRWITKPWEGESFEDGWFGGILDGEGSIGKKEHQGGLNAAQRDGEVWDRMVKYCEDNRYNYRVEVDNRKSGDSSKLGNLPVNKICIGRMDEMFRMIGQTRPSRFLGNRFWEERELPGKKSGIGWATIVSIEELGEQIMIDLQTSAKTYIAEGFVSHNTTYEAIDSLDDALFSRNFNALIIAHEQEPALDIFEGKVSMAWEHFPLQQLYSLDADRANKLRIGFGDGTYSGVAVKTSGRSGTNSRVHISEFAKICAKYPNKAKEILTGTIPSVPLTGRIDIESTAEGENGYFAEMFWEAWNRQTAPKLTEYKAHFYNWTWDKEEIEHAIAMVGIDEVPKEFLDYQRKHELSDKEICYYYLKYLSLNRDMKMLRQEYPTTPEEAFLASGDKVFDVDKLRAQTKEPYEMVGNWKVYKKYDSSHRYGMGADVAEGVGGDSSTGVIWDFTKFEIVATYASNKIPPDLFAHELRAGGNMYGECIIAPERNNHGHATLVILKGIYRNIHREHKQVDMLDKPLERLGWHTNQATKPKMIYELSSAINEDLVTLNSADVISELITYERNDIIKEEETKHWDLVIATAIGWQMKDFALQGIDRKERFESQMSKNTNRMNLNSSL